MSELLPEEMEEIRSAIEAAASFTGGMWWPENQAKFEGEAAVFKKYGRRLFLDLAAAMTERDELDALIKNRQADYEESLRERVEALEKIEAAKAVRT
jgi:hypothetical protein